MVIVAPSKAVNAGGVAVSALEMAQNAERLYWTEDEVDAQAAEDDAEHLQGFCGGRRSVRPGL